MKQYRVDNGVAKFGPGQVLYLKPEQIASRAHNLDLPKGYDGKKSAEVRARVGLDFKVGEVIGLPSLEPRLNDVLVPIDKAETEVEQHALEKSALRRREAAAAKRK